MRGVVVRARILPRDDTTCGWFADLPPAPDPRRVEGDRRADFAVVGAGFTGLAAARRLAEVTPGALVVVLEAQRAGFGASGRSSGFLVDIAHFTTLMDPEAAERHVRLSRLGIDALRRLVERHAIDCAWDDAGWLHVAAGETGVRDLEALRRWLDARGEGHLELDAAALEAVTGTSFYCAGIRLPGRPLVQAAALARGLAQTLPAGVELLEESPVTALERSGDGWRLRTPHGSVTAGRVLLATNGFTPALGLLERSIFPLMTFGSLTRRLTDAEQEALGGEREWGVLAQDPMGSSVRRTRDQRLLVRNTVCYAPSLAPPDRVRRRARRAHRRALDRRFPALAGVELESTWAGVMGASPSRRHVFGRIDEGLYATAGFTGAGIALGTAAGALLAELAAGAGSEALDDMAALPRPAPLPRRPIFDLAARVRVAWMNARAGKSL